MATWRNCSIVALAVSLWLVGVGSCERGAEVSQALIAQRRAAWAREISGIREQHAALTGRLGQEGTSLNPAPAQARMRTVLDGARQSITDVENELAQCVARMEHGSQGSGEAAQRAVEVETAKARGYLQALVAQLDSAATQVDGLTRGTGEAKQATP